MFSITGLVIVWNPSLAERTSCHQLLKPAVNRCKGQASAAVISQKYKTGLQLFSGKRLVIVLASMRVRYREALPFYVDCTFEQR